MNAQQEEARESINGPIPPIELMTNEDWFKAKNEMQMFLYSMGKDKDFEQWVESHAENFARFYQQLLSTEPGRIYAWYDAIHRCDTSRDGDLLRRWLAEEQTELITQ